MNSKTQGADLAQKQAGDYDADLHKIVMQCCSHVLSMEECRNMEIAILNLHAQSRNAEGVVVPREVLQGWIQSLELLDKNSANFKLKAPDYMVDQLEKTQSEMHRALEAQKGSE